MYQLYVTDHDPIKPSTYVTGSFTVSPAAPAAVVFDTTPPANEASYFYLASFAGGTEGALSSAVQLIQVTDLNNTGSHLCTASFSLVFSANASVRAGMIRFEGATVPSSVDLSETDGTVQIYPMECSGTFGSVSGVGRLSLDPRPLFTGNQVYFGLLLFGELGPNNFTGAISLRHVLDETAVYQPFK